MPVECNNKSRYAIYFLYNFTSLFEYYLDHPEELPGELRRMADEYDTEELAKDHVANMTDRYALNLYDELFVIKGWR